MSTKPERIMSPIGEAVWPKLNKPDTKFDKDGVYEVKLRLGQEDAEPFIDQLKTILKTFMEGLDKKKPKMAPLPFREVEDDDGNPTGQIDFKFKLKAIGGRGDNQFTQRPALLDSKRRPMTEEIGGGSRIQIGAEVVTYDVASIGVGISLRLKAVMVHELKQYSREADSWEFSEGGSFVTDGAEAEQPQTERATTSDEFDF